MPHVGPADRGPGHLSATGLLTTKKASSHPHTCPVRCCLVARKYAGSSGSIISCHSFPGVAERLQHTIPVLLLDLSSRASSVYWCPWCVNSRCAGYARGFEAWLTPPRDWWASPTLQTAAGAPTCAFSFGPCLCASRPGSGSCCMLGSEARLVTCGTSNYNLAVHLPALLPMRSVNIISRHCAAVLSWFAAFGLVCQSCFLPRYLACRAGFDLGLRDVALASSTACLLCMPACIAWHHPLYRTVLRPIVPPGTSGPTLD